MVWEGMEGRTNLYRLGITPWVWLHTGRKSPDPLSDHTLIPLTGPHPRLNSIEHLWDIMFLSIRCCLLSTSSVMHWFTSKKILTSTPSIVSLWLIPQCCQSWMQACRGPYKILSTCVSAWFFFPVKIWCVFKVLLNVLIFWKVCYKSVLHLSLIEVSSQLNWG